jgi:hypothetical protein
VTDPFTLTEADKAQNLWLRLKVYFAARLELARIRNDDAMLTEQATAAIRGEIKTLKGLIALGDDRPVITTGDDGAP